MSQTWKDLKGKEPIWCPGCGDFGVLRAMQQVMAEKAAAKDQVLVTGIGCSGTITAYIKTFGFHGIHGRALPAATGVKLANPDLNVVVAGGDGDGFSIGLGHFMHAARRNVDVTYVVMDNQVYGLTKGQTSPTTDPKMTTKASPLGPMADAVRPLELAIAAGATFVAQAFSADMKGLVSMLQQAMDHRGFSLVNVQSPCVTYNLLNTFEWFRDHNRAVDHDVTDRNAALAVARATDHVAIGILYKAQRPCLDEQFQAADIVSAAGDPGASYRQHADRFQEWLAEFQVR